MKHKHDLTKRFQWLKNMLTMHQKENDRLSGVISEIEKDLMEVAGTTDVEYAKGFLNKLKGMQKEAEQKAEKILEELEQKWKDKMEDEDE